MGGPIKPSEVGKRKAAQIPDEVFEAFNDLIAERWDGHSANFLQATVALLALAKLKERLPNITKEDIYEKHWLDVEDAYRAAGWNVEYDRPGYNETYDANFTFRKRKR